MSERITIDELESYLWGAAVLLRTNIDAGAYKQYIFPLLFFKRMCDVYDEETRQAREKYGDKVDLFAEEDIHTFLIPEKYHWNRVREVPENVGQAIVDAFKAVEKANVEKLQGVFGDAAWTNKNRLSDELLKDLLDHFSSKTLSIANCPEDELGQGYEYLIKKFADDSGHTAQEFYTNRTVVHLMTELLKPQPGETVYDPTCGSAGMLVSSVAYLKERNLEWRNLKIYGQEINQLSSAIARMNLFLHGIEDFHIANDDVLLAPAFIKGNRLQTFDIVLANPPYSIKSWNRAAFENDKYGRNFLGVPNQSRADFAFVQHILKSLNKVNGRCAILLPHGILNRQEESLIRQRLIEEDLLDCVIGLGRNLFYNSPMEACILVCRTNKSAYRKNKVLFIDAREYISKVGTTNLITDDQQRVISRAYLDFLEIKGLSSIATSESVAQNDYSLAINRYVVHETNPVTISPLSEIVKTWDIRSEMLQDSLNELINKLRVDS